MMVLIVSLNDAKFLEQDAAKSFPNDVILLDESEMYSLINTTSLRT